MSMRTQLVERVWRLSTVAFFILVEKVVARLSEVLGFGNLGLPPSLLGMFGLWGLLLFLDRISSSSADFLFRFLEPGYRFLLKWAPMFFAPALVRLPLVEERFTFSELVRGALVIAIGGTIQMAFVALFASWLSSKMPRQHDKAIFEEPISRSVPTSSVPYPRPGRPYKRRWLPVYASIMLVVLLSFARGDETETSMAEKAFMLSGTLMAFVAGNSAPDLFKRILHPIFAAVLGCWLSMMIWATHAAPNVSFYDVLVRYSAPDGAGAMMSKMLNPVVVALALLLFERRRLLERDRLPILGTAFAAALSGLFGTALISAILRLPPVLAVASVSRYCTAPLAVAVATSLSASQPLAIAMVVASGFYGVFIVKPLLGKHCLNINGSREKGLALGAVSHVLGTVTLASWDEAAVPYSALIFVLTSGITAALAAIPLVKDSLLWLLTS
eukprot:TRINITY_DN6815_c2_g1_i2.p1 TRINITY_DN6815_c2_g1~~TRINITY_DN6815_c2_g1_i2.p1  ORF type:complete len:466 (-),score=65.08 TRINITY_DN6815_c2_g1_i2:73-1401(-)